jgi:hypothetical protein
MGDEAGNEITPGLLIEQPPRRTAQRHDDGAAPRWFVHLNAPVTARSQDSACPDAGALMLHTK